MASSSPWRNNLQSNIAKQSLKHDLRPNNCPIKMKFSSCEWWCSRITFHVKTISTWKGCETKKLRGRKRRPKTFTTSVLRPLSRVWRGTRQKQQLNGFFSDVKYLISWADSFFHVSPHPPSHLDFTALGPPFTLFTLSQLSMFTMVKRH